ncbi:MAG: 30S ribosomal protein S2 [Sedimentisphaerales bacterium]|nr:30S ribosomal protein S2 [Sedimentisphaerales bacterium]
MTKDLARELINAGGHFGHGASKWNPKMAPYIFGKRGNIHIIGVRQTIKGLLVAKKLVAEVVASGQDVLFVGTKRQAQKAVEDAAAKSQMHYVSQRWPGGLLTNFRTIRSRLLRLEELEAMEQNGSLQQQNKKHAARLRREMRKIRANLDGVRRMARLPGLVVVVDGRKEYIALKEAKKLGIPTIGVLDTDADPDTVDVVIPANDDSIKAIEIILDQLAQAVAEGKALAATKAQASPATPAARRARSRRTTARADEETPGEQAEPLVEELEDIPPAAAEGI